MHGDDGQEGQGSPELTQEQAEDALREALDVPSATPVVWSRPGEVEPVTGTVISRPARPIEVSDELAEQLEAAGWTPPGGCAMGCR